MKYEMTIHLLFGNKKLFGSLVVGIGLIIADLFLQYGVLSAFGFVILYNWMDLMGFRNIIKDGAEVEIYKWEKSIIYHQILQAYRILQHTIEGLLFIIVGLLQGWEWAIIGEFLHFTSFADILYHWIGGYGFKGLWNYQDWTIIGWFMGEGIPTWVIVTQCAVGVILTLTYFILTF